MHESIKKYGLGDVFKIRAITSNTELGKFLGKKVRYKRELLTDEFLKQHGTVCLEVFTIRETQLNYLGDEILRGYTDGDTFGRCINPEFVEII